MLGVVLAGLLQAGGPPQKYVLLTAGTLVFIGLSALLASQVMLPKNAIAATWTLEIMTAALYPMLVALSYAGVLLITYWFFSNTNGSVKYWAGVGTGLLVLAAPAVVTPPGEVENWFFHWVLGRLRKFYQPYFKRLDPDTDQLVGDSTAATWNPWGEQMWALYEEDYVSSTDVPVSGWDHQNRLERARSLNRGLN
ncbi:hypothetical protein [Streptomyces sp. NPDC049555]|uniref:hypothetical protein n=1 Tax=Streptomyces sp. NPDC049555 TaxID=3154930 RepID=UPI00343E4097